MNRVDPRRVLNALKLRAALISLALLLEQVGLAAAETPTVPPPANTIASDRIATKIENDKLKAEIAKIDAETSALKAVGDQTRWWTTVLTAAGSIVGAIVGGIFTFLVTHMGQTFNRLQTGIEESRAERDREGRKNDEKLARDKLRQDQEQAQEMHHLRLFQDLGHQSHRARLAAAAVLLDRLRRLQDSKPAEADEAGTARLIGKVLVAVLKRQTTGAERASAMSGDNNSRSAAIDVTDESEHSLRKYIADELVETLGVRFKDGQRPEESGKSFLGMDRDFQKCDLSDVYWANVDARGVDFFQCNFAEASLRGAALQGAIFYEASLLKTILRGADLRKANLMGCDLQGADLREADLRDANLQGANLRAARLENAILDGAVISNVAILRFQPTARDADLSSATRVEADVYRPASSP